MKKNLTAKIITFIILLIAAISLIFGSFIMLLWNTWETPVQEETYQEVVVENNEGNIWEEELENNEELTWEEELENNEENIWEEILYEEVNEMDEWEENL